jgi:hypothetical protein
MIVEPLLLIFDLSLKPRFRVNQAHFNNQKSSTINRQSMQRRVFIESGMSLLLDPGSHSGILDRMPVRRFDLS